MGGFSQAEVQRIYGSNNISSLTHDSLNNSFIHFWGNYHDLNVSVDYSKGFNSIIGSGPLLSVDNDILTAVAEYNFHIGENLTIKPGVSYKMSNYTGMILGSSEQIINPATFLTRGYEEVIPDDGGAVSNSMISGHL